MLRHPILPDALAVVLQYTNGTLIIMRASEQGAARLRLILDQFAGATGLVINFSKSTLVPMHDDASFMAQVVTTLGCASGVFLQTYLGLPSHGRNCASPNSCP